MMEKFKERFPSISDISLVHRTIFRGGREGGREENLRENSN